MNFSEKILKWIIFSVVIIIGLFVFVFASLVFIPEMQEWRLNSKLNNQMVSDSTNVSAKEINDLKKQVDLLNRKIGRLTPGSVFLTINTTENTFRLYKNNEVIWRGKCSTGSFVELEVDSTKSYIFETPKGALTVQNKITNPVWRKPDWAFIEEGLPVPPQNHVSRYERGVLGDYALSLGNGYLIHGTLYQRLMGMPVTHGCVRLNDEDLEMVYKNMQVGSKVFIY
ncbi:MAG: L,D-transpeptidase [Draconibacterium sp.]